MRRVLIIADDFSGAAEMAGIAAGFGFPVTLLRGRPVTPGALDDRVLVVDSDTRSMPPGNAAETLRAMFAGLSSRWPEFVYKKTDSVLRGPVRAELEALLSLTGRRAALLVPQNPSRGRTIDRDGVYRVGGLPIDQTEFGRDPEHPARSASAVELLGAAAATTPVRFAATPGVVGDGVTIGGAETGAEVEAWAAVAAGDRTILPAGGADFLKALLPEAGGVRGAFGKPAKLAGKTLFACGSTSAAATRLVERFEREGRPVLTMPRSSSSIDRWPDAIAAALSANERVLVTIGGSVDRAPGAPARLLAAFATAVSKVIGVTPIDHLMLEGGATAAAMCREMAWEEFAVMCEWATGVVDIRPRGKDQRVKSIIVKPGSYPWPDALLSGGPT